MLGRALCLFWHIAQLLALHHQRTEQLWERKLSVVYHRPPFWDYDTDDLFFNDLRGTCGSGALVVMVASTCQTLWIPHSWYKTGPGEFLKWLDDKFLVQALGEPMRNGACRFVAFKHWGLSFKSLVVGEKLSQNFNPGYWKSRPKAPQGSRQQGPLGNCFWRLWGPSVLVTLKYQLSRVQKQAIP